MDVAGVLTAVVEVVGEVEVEVCTGAVSSAFAGLAYAYAPLERKTKAAIANTATALFALITFCLFIIFMSFN